MEFAIDNKTIYVQEIAGTELSKSLICTFRMDVDFVEYAGKADLKFLGIKGFSYLQKYFDYQLQNGGIKISHKLNHYVLT